MTDKQYKYKFSIIMSVYKVEEFIDEAVESLLNQTLSFEENVQLIMVDDGSPDGSGAICDKYREKYPDNVVVIHKENGGLSSARNEGLRHVLGEYVNFFDPDDILTPTTLEDVYAFFRKNDSAIDIAAIPLYYFGDATGPHHLNKKFNRGTRVINLEKEYEFIQLSLASAFVKNAHAKKMFFDDKLVIAEDADQIFRIIIENPLLGVISSCKYMYRRRGASQVTAGSTKKGWYNDYVKLFSLKLLNSSKEKFGYIPKFIQNMVMCDLQWRLAEPELPPMLSAEEIAEYKALIEECIKMIDDDIVMRQAHLVLDTKLAILARKHGTERYIKSNFFDVFYGFDNAVNHRFSRNSFQLSFLDVTEKEIRICVRFVTFTTDRIESVHIMIGDRRIQSGELKFINHKKSIGDAVSQYCICDFSIPTDHLEATNRISFHVCVNGTVVEMSGLRTGRFFPLSTKYKEAFCYRNGWLMYFEGGALMICKASKKEKKKRDKKLSREIWKSNKLGERKAVLAKMLARIYKLFHKKPIWIISDRLNKAGDNGEALFRYLKETNNREVEYYYAITDCPDYRKLLPLGNVINRNSLKYKVLHLAADVIISSHADEFVINPFENYSDPYFDVLADKTFVFLQHGITQNDISGWLNKYNKNIRGFITAAKPETKSLLEYNYFYKEENVWLTGFARFDRLYHNEKKYITLMPTWRQYLMNGYDKETGVWNIGPQFKGSDYFKFYNSLINDERLISACKKYGYTLCFLPHPNIIPHIDVFDKNENVKFYSLNDQYRDVYAESNLVLTDYSSAAFDFAYLRKPIVYMQFDADEFFRGEHVAMRGYFDYERDGFGEVVKTVDETVDTIISYMQNDCKMKDEYRKRVDDFFAFDDKNSCQRIADKILTLTKNKK